MREQRRVFADTVGQIGAIGGDAGRKDQQAHARACGIYSGDGFAQLLHRSHIGAPHALFVHDAGAHRVNDESHVEHGLNALGFKETA